MSKTDIKKQYKGWEIFSSVVECLPSKALGLKERERDREKKKSCHILKDKEEP
jgi:hypothetical protein